MNNNENKLKLKEHLKSLGIKNGNWIAPNGSSYKICHQGEFYPHTITITRIPIVYNVFLGWGFEGTVWDKIKSEGKDINESTRSVSYTRMKDYAGRNLYKVSYNNVEEFDILFNQFLLGYKEFRALTKQTSLETDFE